MCAGDKKNLPSAKSFSSRESEETNFTGKDNGFIGGLICEEHGRGKFFPSPCQVSLGLLPRMVNLSH